MLYRYTYPAEDKKELERAFVISQIVNRIYLSSMTSLMSSLLSAMALTASRVAMSESTPSARLYRTLSRKERLEYSRAALKISNEWHLLIKEKIVQHHGQADMSETFKSLDKRSHS